MLQWVTALLCHLGCCEKVCGRCESSRGTGSACPQEALRNHCRRLCRGHAVGWERRQCAGRGWVCSPQGGICKFQEKHRAGAVGAAAVTWEGRPPVISTGILQKQNLAAWGEGAVSSQARAWLYAAIHSDLCSSGPVIHSFSHQLKIPVV